ncbi:MAG: thioester reductase domain-containing protein [Steroidobacteraceae bacterium]
MQSIVTILDALAARHPDRLLYAFLDSHGYESQRLSYGRFVARTQAIAARLRDDQGFVAGDRLLLAYPPGLEMVAAFFACVRVGLVPVPVPLPEARGASASLFRIVHIVADSGARAIITSKAGLEFAASSACEEALATLDWIATDTWPDEYAKRVRHTPGELAFLQYTSGSTGRPRGVMVTHANLIDNCRLVADHEAPVCVTWLPQHHDMGLIGYYIYPALSGGTSYGFAPATFVQRPLLWLEAISRYRATASSAPNFAFEHVLRPGRLTRDRLARLDLSSLRFLMAASEPIKPDTYRRFLQTFRTCGLDPKAFVVAYGLAESTLAVTSYGRRTLSLSKRELVRGRVRVTETVSGIAGAVHLMSCGLPLGDTKVAIVDPDTCERLPAARVGEVWVAGASVSPGYWANSDVSRKTFGNRLNGGDGALYLRTGDIGFLDEGELVICGRASEMIILRGQNFFPQDIEDVAVRAVPAIRSGCIAAFEIERDGEASVALVAEVGGRVDADPLAAVRAVRVALGLDLAEVLFVSPREVPRTSSGKVVRHRACELFLEGRFTVVARHVRGPAPGVHHALSGRPFAQLLARYQLTGTETVALRDVGIDSLDLVSLLHELQELLAEHGAGALGDEVDTRLVQQMTIAEFVGLAALIETMPEQALNEVRTKLRTARTALAANELRMMSEDASLPFSPLLGPVDVSAAPTKVLLTGATGFLGPFLLASLLEQTSARIVAPVRADNESEAMARLRAAVRQSGLEERLGGALGERLETVCGDLEQPKLGFGAHDWDRLTHSIDAIFHNGALVNYLFDYARMRATNVNGTAELLRLACTGQPKIFNHISSTFIFGWATKPLLLESDANGGMELLDFGYSQSKWASERMVADAGSHGLRVRIFRPALITPSLEGQGNGLDITIRLLAFMLSHGIGVTAENQVSFLPADVAADNIVAIAGLADTVGGTFHVTRDDYQTMEDVTDMMTLQTGKYFELFDLQRFVPEVIRRCRRDDLLFPLLEFLIRSVNNIASMEFKRYDNSAYRAARDRSLWGRRDPPLDDTIAGILSFMERKGIFRL